MKLSQEKLMLLQAAIKEYGKAGLARHLGITRQAIYDVLNRGSGFNPTTFAAIEKLMQPQAAQTAASAPSVAIAPVQPSSPSDTAEIDRLLAIELHKLSIEDKRKVYRYVVELQVKRQAEEI